MSAAAAGLLAHGGAVGAVIELGVVIGLFALLGLVWLHGRRLEDEKPEDDSGASG